MTPKIIIYRERQSGGEYSWSTFVNKLEARLRFSHVNYEVKQCNMFEAPRSKIPYARIGGEDGLAPELISDSVIIAQHLTSMGVMKDLNEELTPTQKAMDLSIRALIEDRLYWLIGRERWLEHFYKVRDEGPLSFIPWPVRVVVGQLAYSKNAKTLYGQGTARYTDEEWRIMCQDVWTSLNDLVGANVKKGSKKIPWILGGDEPTEADTVLYGILVAVMTATANPKAQEDVKAQRHLVSYWSKIHDVYFPDYPKATL